jgi:hypothetical protein
MRSWFEWVNEFPTSIAIRESVYGYPAILTTHVIGMCLFMGLIVMMDLRLAGIGNTRTPFSEIQRRTFPWQVAGMTVSSVTGLLLFYGQPMRFYSNVFFWLKAVMMVLAGLNALVFHYTTYASVSKWDTKAATPFGARLAGVVSLALWAGVVLSGRLIAYNWFD